MDNADLEKLKISSGKLIPMFKASIEEYSVTVSSKIEKVHLSPLTSDSGASYVIKGAEDKTVKLTDGQTHSVKIIVTAEDGKFSKTYLVSIHRLSTNNASLSQLELSAGSLEPVFSPVITKYECYLPNSIDSLSVEAKTQDTETKISMTDGSPVETVRLTPGRTSIELVVQSVNEKVSNTYTITVIKNRLPVTLQLKNSNESFECAVCCGVVASSSKIKDGPYVYCQSCLKELTRTNKIDPFTDKKLGDEQWMIEDYKCDLELGKEIGICPTTNGVVESSMEKIGAKLLTQRLMTAQAQEPTEPCADCSKKVPTADMPLHKEMLCSAQHTNTVPKQEVKLKSWQCSLVDDSLGSNVKELLKKAENYENEYLKSLPKSGQTQHYTQGNGPLSHLWKAAQCYATALRRWKAAQCKSTGLKNSAQEVSGHIGLGLVMEEFVYAEDMYGLERNVPLSSTEGEAECSSKEEEFIAICKLHGVSASATMPVQLKAVETEYHSLKDAGNTHKAEHVQELHAWKSKKILLASQGSYAVDVESPLYQAKQKFLDAVSTNSSDSLACYHLGRLCLLLGENDSSKDYLKAAVALNPTNSEARFCLGLVLPASSDNFAKPLILHGLSEYLTKNEETNQTQAKSNQVELKELNSKTLYRSSNPLLVDGFLRLSKLGGHGHLSPTHCLLAVSPIIAIACLQNRATTYEKLLWGSLKARSYILQLLHKRKQQRVLRHCRQLSALIANSGLTTTPQVRELQQEVFQFGVILQPSSSEALCHLGSGQLSQYDATNENIWLCDSVKSYRASIAMEGNIISATLVPEQLKKQEWWKTQETLAPQTSLKTTSQMELAASNQNQSVPLKQPAVTSQIKPISQPNARAAQPNTTKIKVPLRTTVGAQVARKPVGSGTASVKHCGPGKSEQAGKSQQAVKPSTFPGVKLTSPGVKPSTSPGVKLTSPGVKLTSPGVKLTSPGVKPSTSPGVKLTSPGVKLTSPGVKPSTSPGVKLTSPGVKPSISPGVKLTSPGVKLTSPGVKLTSPGVKPTSPGVKLTSPGVKPISPGAKPTSSGGKGVAPQGVSKSDAQKNVATANDGATSQATPQREVVETQSTEQPLSTAATEEKGDVNKCTYHPRLGLARALAKTSDRKKYDEALSLYREVISMAPEVHDAYIELGEMLAKENPVEAVDVYSKFPFNNPPTFDDAYLHGEIVRLLMSSENYDDPRLSTSMIAMGRALGIGVLEKQVSVLEAKFKSSLLKQIYAGVHGKPIDDLHLQAFFQVPVLALRLTESQNTSVGLKYIL